MTGRGIDQILPCPVNAELHEPYVRSALDYVRIAEARNGPIPRAVPPAYIWGDALDVLQAMQPDARIVNLETAVTTSDAWIPKGINYRMHPANVACLTAAQLDCCVLANSHVLDWGEEGLLETLATLHAAGFRTAGAGIDAESAYAPAVLERCAAARVLVFGLGVATSGIPSDWAAGESKPGVAFLPRVDLRSAEQFAARVHKAKRRNDIVIVSIHWGGNWGYGVSAQEIDFAHALIDLQAADIVHGHSSHHPKAMAVYRNRLILWGCGDLINDYEGISGHEAFRPDLGLMYFVTLDDSGELAEVEMVATQMKNFRLTLAPAADSQWLCRVLSRECDRFGTTLTMGLDARMRLCRPDRPEDA